MLTDADLYTVRVETYNQVLLQLVGERSTVIETALRVMLDCAPAWSDVRQQPMFNLYVHKFKP